MTDARTKICSRCPAGDNVKPVTEFFKNASNKDGLFAYCKACHKQAEARPERVANRKAYKALYHVLNADKINARSVQWQKDNPERANTKSKRSYKKRTTEKVAAGEREAPKIYLNRMESLIAGQKPCSQCGIVKLLTEFYEWTSSPDGVQAECKICHNERSQPIHERDLTIHEKPCAMCGVPKLAEDFYNNPYLKDGMDSLCKICRHASNAAWSNANPHKRKIIANRSAKRSRENPVIRPRIDARVHRWRQANPERCRLHRRTDRAKNGQKPSRRAARLSTNQRWFAQHPSARRAASQKRRALLRNATIVDAYIDVWFLYERDHGICTLCDMSVNRTLCWPDLRMATIDHRIPVTRGGVHGYENTKLAHHYCNTLKNNRLETPAILASIHQGYLLKFGMPEPQHAGPASGIGEETPARPYTQLTPF